MAHSEARAWWADVQHLRNDYERTDEARRRADEADLAARRATRERRHVEAEVSSVIAALPGDGAAVQPPRRAADSSLHRRAQHSDLAAESRRGNHLDLSPAPRVRQGVGPAAGARSTRAKGAATPGRVTVEIRGRTVPAPAVPRSTEIDRTRRPQRRAVERVGARPDRVAMWALMMGLLLILVAIGTADGPAAFSLLLR
jgi:hypothetical protein